MQPPGTPLLNPLGGIRPASVVALGAGRARRVWRAARREYVDGCPLQRYSSMPTPLD
jgi:hypothetical protein